PALSIWSLAGPPTTVHLGWTAVWRIGINTWAWVAPLTDTALVELAPRIKDWGFDAIELPVQGWGWDPERASALLAELGLTPVVCAGLLPEHDLLTDDDETLQQTTNFLKRCIQVAVQLGASVDRKSTRLNSSHVK